MIIDEFGGYSSIDMPGRSSYAPTIKKQRLIDYINTIGK
jgi:hypothetical protein